MTDVGEPRVRVVPPQLHEKIGEVVVDLPVIGDIAARPRGAMTAEIDRDRGEAGIRQTAGDRVHLAGRAGRAMAEEDNRGVPGDFGGIKPVGEPGSVSPLEATELGETLGIDLHHPVQHGGQRRRRLQRSSEKGGEDDGRHADQREQPDEQTEDDRHETSQASL